MHRTLKAETTRPPAHDHAAQQRRFNTWRLDFNTVRPHEALGMDVPISRYEPSSRSFKEGPISVTYPGHFEVRHVRNRGGERANAGIVDEGGKKPLVDLIDATA